MAAANPNQDVDIIEIDDSPKSFTCTICKVVITSTFEANLHPLLRVLICRKCYRFYGDGDFSLLQGGVDAQGYDNFCRWCVDGGNLIGCQNQDDYEYCRFSICEKCIRDYVPSEHVLQMTEEEEKNLGQETYKFICYVCDTKPIAYLQDEAIEALKHFNDIDKPEKPFATHATLQDIQLNLKQLDSFKTAILQELNAKYQRVVQLCLDTRNPIIELRKDMARVANEGMRLAIKELETISTRLSTIIDSL